MQISILQESHRSSSIYVHKLFEDGDIWICKPTGRNQGKGIYLVRDKEEIRQLCETHDNNQKPGKQLKPLNRIIQR